MENAIILAFYSAEARGEEKMDVGSLLIGHDTTQIGQEVRILLPSHPSFQLVSLPSNILFYQSHFFFLLLVVVVLVDFWSSNPTSVFLPKSFLSSATLWHFCITPH